MIPAEDAVERIAGWQRNALLTGVAGVLAAIVAALLDREHFLRSYLFAYVFWVGMGVGCLGILLMHHTVGGKWGMVLRRLCEAGACTLPFTIVLMIPIVLSLPALYEWARPEVMAHDVNIQKKAGYLNVPAFLGRAILYFAVWGFYAFRLRTLSTRQDTTGDAAALQRMQRISAPGLVVFFFVSTFAFVDWVMSLEPHWFSTIYGAMFLIGEALEAFAFTIGLLIILAKLGPMRPYVTKQHLHDLGNMMFAFMVLWAYLAFSQFLIIWAGNLPEEIPWYLRRLRNGWGWVALALVIFHFAAPFVLLLMRDVKRQADRLLMVCILLFAIRIVDMYWLIEPAFYGDHVVVRWTDVVAFIAVGGLWLAGFFYFLKSAPLAPVRDPRLAEAPRETVAF